MAIVGIIVSMYVLIKVLKQSLSDVTEMSFKPGDPFPDPQDKREGLCVHVFLPIVMFSLSLGKDLRECFIFGGCAVEDARYH